MAAAILMTADQDLKESSGHPVTSEFCKNLKTYGYQIELMKIASYVDLDMNSIVKKQALPSISNSLAS